MRGLVVDLFAGGGGASLGLKMALGRDPDIAINHDPKAISMHAANHPHTRHMVESVWRARPREVTAGQPVDVLWMSPDCTHFSKAKGAAPKRDPRRSKRSRGLAWVGIRWAVQVRPRVIFLENVEEFEDWGPVLKDGRPCKRRKGQTFRRWVAQLERLGYRVGWWELKACDYGAPTIRKRLFLVARCDGEEIVKPVPTHGPALTGLKPFRTAADIIDWSIPCPSIFERKKPLAEATQKRIARGIKRYVLDNPHPFIVPVTHQGDDRVHSIDEPLRTITTAQRGEHSLVTPYLTGCGGRAAQSPPKGVDKPLNTVTGKADQILSAPVITKFHNESAGSSVEDPLATITSNSFIKRPGGAVPLGVVASSLVQYHSERRETDDRSRGLDQPLPTQTTENRFGLVASFLAQHNTGMVGHEIEKPMSTIVGKGCTQQVVTANLTHNYTSNTNGGQGDLERPHKTLTTGGHHALVASHMVQMKGSDRRDRPTDAPTWAITAKGWHVAEVRAFLMKYFGTATGQDLIEPLHTATAKGRFGLVTVEGELYQIADIGMRMLSPRELFRAQGFPDTYIIDRTADGVPLTKTDQIRMCGNSVCPDVAAALIRANARFAMTEEAKRRAA